MQTTAAPRVATTYAAARQRFLEAAGDAGAKLSRFVADQRGIDGEELAIDTAWLGRQDADDVVVLVSGTHGVEGFGGSHVQSRMLERGAVRGDVSILMIHALNPYGMSWARRADADNIDVNRNALVAGDRTAENAMYAKLATRIVPPCWTEIDCLAHADMATDSRWRAPMSDGVMMLAVSSGQGVDPRGVGYRGKAPCWSARQLDTIVESVRGRRRIDIIDLHSGLGERGQCTALLHAEPGSARHRAAVQRFRTPLLPIGGSGLRGLWADAVAERLTPSEVTAITIECGTIGVDRLLPALRADAWLHGYGDPTGPIGGAVRAAMRAAFVGEEDSWAAGFSRGVERVLADIA